MKSLKELWIQIALDMGDLCGVCTSRDGLTVLERVEHEGLSFLTIALPQFCADFQKSLEQGRVTRDLFAGFKRRAGLPQFLGGFLERVFDRKSGLLLDQPCVDSISAVRQLTLVMGKIALPCSDQREKLAIQGYIECESDVRRSDACQTSEGLEDFRRMALLLFGDIMAKVDLAVYNGDLMPKHGPGATADRRRGNAKYDQWEWTQRLERVFPYGEFAIPSWRYHKRLDRVNFREPGQERPVRVILVPKTLKTPRVIAVEPTCMQYMQQAIAGELTVLLESDHSVSSLIGFSDQTPNQRMAKRGSLGDGLATIDLSEASDRVSNQHVRLLFQHFPHLFDAVDATRSRSADVPGHGVIRLAKFASMGSALCFPVEAMVFLTVVFLGLQDAHSSRMTRKDIQSYAGRVRIYGDDIIVPVDALSSVLARLTAFGLKVNRHKSFWNGKFRESCGRDYYDGTDVTPVRVRHAIPSSRTDVREVISFVSLRNRLYAAGCWRSARWCDDRIPPLLGGRYPAVGPESPVIGRFSFLGFDTERMSPSLHRPEVKGWCTTPELPSSTCSGEGALMKWFLKRGDEPFADRKHLERSGRPESARIRLRWAPSA